MIKDELADSDNDKLQDWCPKRLFAVFGCRSLSQSPGVSFVTLGVVENPRFAVVIGATENAGPENARPENDGPNSRT